MLDPGKRLEILQKNTNNKEGLPLFWDKQNPDGSLYAKKGKTHTLLISAKIPQIELDSYEVKVTGDGQVLDHQEKDADSWVRNYYNWVSSLCAKAATDGTFGEGYINWKATDTTIHSGNYGLMQYQNTNLEADTNYGYVANYGTSTTGILVGTGTTAVNWSTDYKIETQIAHGNGSGQLLYATSQKPAPDAWDSGTRDKIYKLSRFFDNFSGDNVTVKEMVQYLRARYYTTIILVLVARDLISPNLVVPHRAQAEIAYRYKLNFPSSSDLLRNYYNLVFCQGAALNGHDSTFGDGLLNLKDTGGTIRNDVDCPTWGVTVALDTSVHKGFNEAVGTITNGGVVGTSNTAVTFDDYQLGSIIADGNGTGQLEYSVTEDPTRTWTAATDIMTIQHARTFSNDSGATVTVKESGLIGNPFILNTYFDVLMHHNVFADIAIADGENLRIVWQFDVQYPS